MKGQCFSAWFSPFISMAQRPVCESPVELGLCPYLQSIWALTPSCMPWVLAKGPLQGGPLLLAADSAGLSAPSLREGVLHLTQILPLQLWSFLLFWSLVLGNSLNLAMKFCQGNYRTFLNL